MKRSCSLVWLPTATLVILLLLFIPGCGETSKDAGKLSSGVRDVIDAAEFKYSTWGIRVVDLETGKEVYESFNQDTMLDPASTTKLFTVATAFDVLGADYRFKTPVYANGEVGPNGQLKGDLILVASGDLDMGGRTTPEGNIEYTNADHNDANALGTGELTETDPLAGLNDLARQVAESGIKEVSGDVLIDDRLYGPGRSFDPNEEYIITPIMINDNLIDFTIKPTRPGSPAEIEWRPQAATYQVETQVQTVSGDQEAGIEIKLASPGLIVVEGQVPEGESEMVRTYQVEDPASFARTLFIEALARAGVTVDSPETRENASDGLPGGDDYPGMQQVALLESPPFAKYAKLILKVSHNLGADTLLYLIAVHEGKQTMEDGLQIEGAFLKKAGVDTDGLVLNDGQGATGANLVSPDSAIGLLRYMSTRDDYETYRDCLPVLGVDGSLAKVLTDSPAKGKVQAKTGTHLGGDTMNNRAVAFARALAGYMTTASGRELVFDINVNNVPIGEMSELKGLMEKHAGILEIIYKEY